jgi:hypothetical protein
MKCVKKYLIVKDMVENRRARDKAHRTAMKISSKLEPLLYFIYSLIYDDWEDAPDSNQEHEKQEPNNHIDTVVLFVNAKEGSYLKQQISHDNMLDIGMSRDLYASTQYMWSGLANSEDFSRIIKLYEIADEESEIPELDVFFIIIPINSVLRKEGILEKDSANRVSFFNTICSNNTKVEVSNVLSYKRLPKDILYVKG